MRTVLQSQFTDFPKHKVIFLISQYPTSQIGKLRQRIYGFQEVLLVEEVIRAKHKVKFNTFLSTEFISIGS